MGTLISILSAVAPAVCTALGGPLAGVAVAFIAKHFGIDPDKVQQYVSQMSPADLEKMKELDDNFQVEMAKVGISLDMAQIGVNQVEAASTNWFVAGWRPAVGWTCCLSFAYAFVLLPLLQFGVFTWGSATLVAQLAHMPALDLTTMMPVLLGMLGLGGLRTVEKVQNVEGNR